MKINIPTSMCKSMLAQHGDRVRPEAIEAFKEMFKDWANDIAKAASRRAKAGKRKTIYVEDFKDAGIDDDNN